jgi:hypothetical protein
MTIRLSLLAAVPLGLLLCGSAWAQSSAPGDQAHGTLQAGSSAPSSSSPMHHKRKQSSGTQNSDPRLNPGTPGTPGTPSTPGNPATPGGVPNTSGGATGGAAGGASGGAGGGGR